ncbi:MAG: hypothetical protein GQ574_04130 [Crocinitomix sp.]|nr:hypothetical protein [Crocinitomix sp.]
MEKERLLNAIIRYDHYYDSINNKANVALGLSTFVTGAMAALYPVFAKIADANALMYVIYFLMIAIGMTTIITLVFAATPYMKNSTNSLIYFKSVADMSEMNFKRVSEKRTEDQELDDLREQTHDLASGLSSKFKRLKLVFRLLTIQFFLAIPLIILLIQNYHTNEIL